LKVVLDYHPVTILASSMNAANTSFATVLAAKDDGGNKRK